MMLETVGNLVATIGLLWFFMGMVAPGKALPFGSPSRWKVAGIAFLVMALGVGIMQADPEYRARKEAEKQAKANERAVAKERPSSSSSPSLNWYEGGTLHRKTAGDWRTASQRDRLATSADFAAIIAKQKGMTFSSMSSLRPEAVAIERCISEASKPPVPSEMKIAELAAGCALLLTDSK